MLFCRGWSFNWELFVLFCFWFVYFSLLPRLIHLGAHTPSIKQKSSGERLLMTCHLLASLVSSVSWWPGNNWVTLVLTTGNCPVGVTLYFIICASKLCHYWWCSVNSTTAINIATLITVLVHITHTNISMATPLSNWHMKRRLHKTNYRQDKWTQCFINSHL